MAADDVFLETERLVLRRFHDGDLDCLVELDSDPEVMRYISGGRARPREEIERDVLPALLRYYEHFVGYGFWAAIEKGSATFIGWFHLRPGPGAPVDEPELGYRLRASAWGKGYATEGSRRLIDKAFTELGAKRVVAGTMAVNIRSRRVMEKAGLTLVRTYHRNWPYPVPGADEGEVEYAIRRVDWETSAGD
jgi:RimJ/RimL family protein N-acetyltransferase